MNQPNVSKKSESGYLVFLDGDELVITSEGDNGLILASSNESRIGKRYTPPKHSETSDINIEKNLEFFDGEQNVTIVDANKSKEQEKIVETLAKIFIQEHLDCSKIAADSTDAFIRKLVTTPEMSSDLSQSLESEAKVLGYDLEIPRSAIVLRLEGFSKNYLAQCSNPTYEKEKIISDWKQKIENTVAAFFTKNKDFITAYLGDDKFIIFKSLGDSSEERFIKTMKTAHASIFGPLKNHNITNISVSFSRAQNGVQGLHNSYQEAEYAVELGEIFFQNNQPYFFGDLGILFILADGDRKKKIQFANQLLSNLDNKEFLETLEAFFENNLNITDTADHLGIHRNTVIYRLDRLSNFLKLDPRHFVDAVSIKIALILRKIAVMNSQIQE